MEPRAEMRWTSFAPMLKNKGNFSALERCSRFGPLGTGTSCVPGSSGHAFGTSTKSYMQTLPTQCYSAATRAKGAVPQTLEVGQFFGAEQFARAILGQNNLQGKITFF